MDEHSNIIVKEELILKEEPITITEDSGESSPEHADDKTWFDVKLSPWHSDDDDMKIRNDGSHSSHIQIKQEICDQNSDINSNDNKEVCQHDPLETASCSSRDVKVESKDEESIKSEENTDISNSQPKEDTTKEFGGFMSVYDDWRANPKKFFEFTRMSVDTFDYIFWNIEEDIIGRSAYKKSVSPTEKLLITLRYLGHRTPIRSLAETFGLGRSTISKSIHQTLKAIWKNFTKSHMPEPNTQRFENIAGDFYTKWQFPNCIGTIDEKNFLVTNPSVKEGECYTNFNYKRCYSLVLQAISDADSRFVAIDVIDKRTLSDGDTFHVSQFNNSLNDNTFNAPPPEKLPDSDIILPHVLVGGENYPLKTYLMRPYPSRHLSDVEKLTFNKRLCRAKSSIDCAYAILTTKFRVLINRFETTFSRAKLIIKVTCLLHNIIRDRDGIRDQHYQQICKNYKMSVNTGRSKFKSVRNNRSAKRAMQVRDSFKNYFVTHPLEEEPAA